MLLDGLLLLLGLALILFGAEFLVDGSSAIARRFGISEFVIGLTIVGMGTSAPEMVVSLVAAFQGNADISIGNVAGSNIFNTLLILGVTAVIMPIAITPGNKKRDIPLNFFVTVAVLLLGMNHTVFGMGRDALSQVDGLVMLAVFASYMYCSFRNPSESPEDSQEKSHRLLVAAGLSVMGIAALIGGGKVLVNSAVNIAGTLGVSDKFIAITILAGGTSLPELATCIVAAVKKKGQLALGNIVGSNIFNLLLILGSSALVRPLSFAAVNLVDAAMLTLSAVLIWLSCVTWRKNCIDRGDGLVLLTAEGFYLCWLFINA